MPYHKPYPTSGITSHARALRQHATDAEKRIWRLLREAPFAEHKFRRQYPIPPYIVDFACIKHRLVIELDGGQHNAPPQQNYDARRTACLRQQGWQVLRFWNHDVLLDPQAVAATILARIESPFSRREKAGDEGLPHRR